MNSPSGEQRSRGHQSAVSDLGRPGGPEALERGRRITCHARACFPLRDAFGWPLTAGLVGLRRR